MGFDPTNERAYRGAMKAFYDEGDRATALKYYETCRETLDRELGIDLSEETENLAQNIIGRKAVQTSRQIISPDNNHLFIEEQGKPIVQIQEFVTAKNDPVLDFVAQTFRADISEQLSRNERFAVRELGIVDPNATVSLNGLTYIIRGNIINVGDSTNILLQLVEEGSGDILWMKRIAPEMKALLAGQDEQALMAAVEMYQIIELKETDKATKAEEGMLTARQC